MGNLGLRSDRIFDDSISPLEHEIANTTFVCRPSDWSVFQYFVSQRTRAKGNWKRAISRMFLGTLEMEESDHWMRENEPLSWPPHASTFNYILNTISECFFSSIKCFENKIRFHFPLKSKKWDEVMPWWSSASPGLNWILSWNERGFGWLTAIFPPKKSPLLRNQKTWVSPSSIMQWEKRFQSHELLMLW